MVNKIILKYVIKKKIYRKLFIAPVSVVVILAIIMTLVSGNIMNFIAVLFLMSILIISGIMSEYEILNRTDFVPTPLNILERKYSEIVVRHDEIEFLGINPDECLALKGVIKEFEEAMDILKAENGN